MLKTLLELEGHKVVTAETGKQAMEISKELITQ
jgi:CheY-like chemotaxis protein